MIVLSLFDGISCAHVALDRSGIPIHAYYASEIDKYAIQVSSNNHPDIFHIGDVKKLHFPYGTISSTGHKNNNQCDLLIGGSPCQDLSIAKKNRQGLDGDKSSLFREYVRIMKEVKPKRFVLENVASMPKEAKKIITETLGVEPIMINAALVSAQSRKRLFRTNIPGVQQPADRGILLKDIVQDNVGIEFFLSKETQEKIQTTRGNGKQVGQAGRIRSLDGKSVTLQASGGGTGAKTGLYYVDIQSGALRTYPRNKTDEKRSKRAECRKDGKANCVTSVNHDSLVYIEQKARGFNKGGKYFEKSPTLTSSRREMGNHLVKSGRVRKLTPIECERLQGLPDDYTAGISNTQRYKCLGNAFNVDVVAHILSFIPHI